MKGNQTRRINFQSIFRNESRIDDLLFYNKNKYEYRGEEGKEYRVIHSIFSELNRIGQVDNKHIRWYSVIINLIFRFYHQRLSHCSPGISLPLSDTIPKYTTKIADQGPDEFYIPIYIELLESYINGISRLGVLQSSGEKIHINFLNHNLGKINLTLNLLLASMNESTRNHFGEAMYILTIKNATENILILTKSCSGEPGNTLKKLVKSEIFSKIITNLVEKMTDERKHSLYNINDFWNGLIP